MSAALRSTDGKCETSLTRYGSMSEGAPPNKRLKVMIALGE